jgi:hypothetical protein
MENNINLDELLLIGDYSICQYSGLPSISSYVMEEENEDFYTGHS